MGHGVSHFRLSEAIRNRFIGFVRLVYGEKNHWFYSLNYLAAACAKAATRVRMKKPQKRLSRPSKRSFC